MNHIVYCLVGKEKKFEEEFANAELARRYRTKCQKENPTVSGIWHLLPSVTAKGDSGTMTEPKAVIKARQALAKAQERLDKASDDDKDDGLDLVRECERILDLAESTGSAVFTGSFTAYMHENQLRYMKVKRDEIASFFASTAHHFYTSYANDGLEPVHLLIGGGVKKVALHGWHGSKE